MSNIKNGTNDSISVKSSNEIRPLVMTIVCEIPMLTPLIQILMILPG